MIAAIPKEFLNFGGGRGSKFSGVVVALVVDNKDPEERGRIKIKFPWMGKETGTAWARLVTLMGGKNRGIVFYPEVDDEVLVAFEQGNVNYPYIIGALWNGKDKPPEKNSDGKNNIKMIKTRSGNTIKIDDTENKEKIEIVSKENKIVIDSSKKNISIKCGGNIELSAPEGKVSIKAKEIEIISSSSAKVEAKAGMDLKASGVMKIKGSMVNIN